MSVQILQGDSLELLRTLPDASVHCCITSPPYYGLRDYGTAKWEGGDTACDHVAPKTGGTKHSTLRDENGWLAEDRASQPDNQQYRSVCSKCGGRRIDAQLGLESTPEEYVSKLVAVFQEVRRVLRDDGTLWLNLGDSYAGIGKGSGGTYELSEKQNSNRGSHYEKDSGEKIRYELGSLKPKDLIGIPWRVAFALQADGWYLRQDIIWAKPNPMPESVRDRCTKAHEYVFMLSKKARYYYQAEEIMEPSITQDARRPYGSKASWEIDGRPEEQKHGGEPRSWKGSKFTTGATGKRQLGRAQSEESRTSFNRYQTNAEGAFKRGAYEFEETRERGRFFTETRNRRSVWTIPTRPLGGGVHFAVFPPELITPMVLAGCPEAGTVLDPFAGSGTTGMVAENLGRNSILIELNPKYIELIKKRTAQCGMIPEEDDNRCLK